MIIGFAKHRDTDPGAQPRGADRYRRLTNYMDSPTVTKIIDGRAPQVTRDPVPEILAGDASALRRQIAALPFQRRYRFGMLSFAAQDVDVAAFNAGDPASRIAVGQAIDLLRETLWPGVPVPARPMLYVTTHTHTGRLEVNFAVPRAVRGAAGKIRSYNPDPPSPGGAPSRLWRAARDVLNQRFGWADPEDPRRARPLTARLVTRALAGRPAAPRHPPDSAQTPRPDHAAPRPNWRDPCHPARWNATSWI